MMGKGERIPKHLHVDKGVWGELEEIAERQGRDEHELYREALWEYVEEQTTPTKVHGTVPLESNLREGDRAKKLDFQVMWTADGKRNGNHEKGDQVFAMEFQENYFDFLKFTYDGELYTCRKYLRFPNGRFKEISERFEAYTI